MSKVAYKLELPVTTKIHPVFHVSQLKMCKGTPLVAGVFPQIDDESLLMVQPVTVLDRKLTKHGNVGAVYLLVQWADSSPEDATWELASEVMARFPKFNFYP